MQFHRQYARNRVGRLWTFNWRCIAFCGAQATLLAVTLAAGKSQAFADEVDVNSQANTKSGAKANVEKLIRELGSPQYTARRAAANELRRIGPDAFDSLFTATEDADPEIAASANYLLRQIPVRWVHNDDTPAVRRILRNYGASTDDSRLADIRELTMLPKREGLASLCRIARFDRSPLISRTAALAVIWPDSKSARRAPIDPEVIDREIGPSMRTASTWLRQTAGQLREPSEVAATWQRFIDEEAARLEQNSEETSAEILVGLMWNLADIYRRTENQPAMSQLIEHMVALESDNPEGVAVAVLMWLVEEKSWASVENLLDRHPEQFARGKQPLYAAAIARKQLGKIDVAEELAERASREEVAETLGAFVIAMDLEYRDLYEWAAREHRRTIDRELIDAPESIVARVRLANLLHDHEEDQQAADVLAPLVKANADPTKASIYDRVRSVMLDRYVIGIPEKKQLAAQYHFYLACAHHAAKNWQLERDELLLAIKFDPTDTDVLIAMHRVPEPNEDKPNEEWKNNVRQRIKNMEAAFQREIDADPDNAQNYNQWAWLISNTEGDFQKAIRYSHKSLELNTHGESASASFLDTLGRCYYAAGDYENAVKYQRQAVEQVSYLKTMTRQLALFEKALAEKDAGGASR